MLKFTSKVLWSPRGEPALQEIRPSGRHFYAKSPKTGRWWRLSKVGKSGWRAPVKLAEGEPERSVAIATIQGQAGGFGKGGRR